MQSLGLSKQIIILAIFPALLVGIMLSVYFTYDQLSYITQSQKKYGVFIIRQIQPVVEHALTHDGIKTLETILRDIISNEDVDYIKIKNTANHDVLTINNLKNNTNDSFFYSLLKNKNPLNFNSPVYHTSTLPNGTPLREVIADIEIKLNANRATTDKIKHIIKGGTITFAILFVFSIFILKLSKTIISPIKSLTESVRNITAGDLDSQINIRSKGELGILEHCINHMKNELKDSRTDVETRLNTYTKELQQTMGELEIRNTELDITRSKAIYASNAKSEFLANMSHEIRTPLSGIIGFTELLQGTALSSQQRDYSDTIQKSSKNLLEIINDVLDLSKIESGKIEIARSEFNLLDIIEDIINLLCTSALEKNIELLYKIDNDVPSVIKSDPFRIHQILMNLIGNAIKFTEKGYVYLQITSDKINDTETSIKFTVSDTGIGMNNPDKKKLFKAFTQADTSITRRFGGTGLGLVISRKLTLLMQGEMDFDSTEDQGSTFWFSIPATSMLTPQKKTALNNKNIAFINNHFIAAQAYKAFFEKWHCQVNNYSLENFNNITDIEKENDIVIFFLSRKNIYNDNIIQNIGKLTISKPSLLIASTRSHAELKNLQQHSFDNAVFTSEKTEVIKQKLLNILDKKIKNTNIDVSSENTKQKTDWSNINILVVDDNDVNLRLAEIILHKHKACVTTARSGTIAIDYASMNSFDIIFMDLHMPGLDGYQTTTKIREITPGQQPVIIALTANAMPQEKNKATQSGMNGILIKPVSDDIFQEVVNQWVLKEPMPQSNISDDIDEKKSQETTRSNAVFSIDLAKEFTGGNEELAYELFNMLRGELNNYKNAITSAVKNNNLSDLREQVHKLHGASRCCGTTELQQASSHVENLINKNINFDIEKEINLLLIAIKNVAAYKT
ncbi:BarA sensory histidine kinase (= VarS = GacS) [hydrothermal vent metagenome]|uniref:histidine kinase n=1 Tax=hydrothermal vent metagenome TaxID=652676 RepID=A0A3B0WT31_9ZZZZ